MKAIGQPATLITNNLGFHVGSKIVLNENGEEVKAQLVKQVTSTPSFVQFQFKYLGQKPEPASNQAAPMMDADDDFDSIWSSL